MTKRRLTRDLQAEAEEAAKRDRLETRASRRKIAKAGEHAVWCRYLMRLGVRGKDLDRLADMLQESEHIVQARQQPVTRKLPEIDRVASEVRLVPHDEEELPADDRATFIADMVQAGFSAGEAVGKLNEISRNAVFCEHANEVPHKCPCPSYCYCRVNGSCRK